MIRYKNLINGKWESSEKEIAIYSPINREELGTVPSMNQKEVDNAIIKAKKTKSVWRSYPPIERSRYLCKVADILDRDREAIGHVLSKEIAKGITAAIREVSRTADLIRYTAEEGLRLCGQVLEGGNFESDSNQKLSVVRREPVGIVLAISPFNYPVNLSASKIAAALIGGNVVVFKPPTQGAISGLLLAKAFDESGLPPGVLNTITGRGSEIGDYIIGHEDVNYINFTGSTSVGKRIGMLAGIRPILLELGGKDAAIVLEDANLGQAAKEIVSGAFSYSGQRCTAIKRVIVMDSVADELAQLIRAEVQKLSVGDPLDDADITPVIDHMSADYVWNLIEDARRKGATALTELKRSENLIWPAVFDHVSTNMKLAWEEPFGPVLPIIRVLSIDEAIDICNQSEFGLQSAIFTNNFIKAFTISEKLEVGTVQINNKTQRSPDNFPFAGIKGSGIGVQGIRYSIEAMTRLKSVVFNLK